MCISQVGIALPALASYTRVDILFFLAADLVASVFAGGIYHILFFQEIDDEVRARQVAAHYGETELMVKA